MTTSHLFCFALLHFPDAVHQRASHSLEVHHSDQRPLSGAAEEQGQANVIPPPLLLLQGKHRDVQQLPAAQSQEEEEDGLLLLLLISRVSILQARSDRVLQRLGALSCPGHGAACLHREGAGGVSLLRGEAGGAIGSAGAAPLPLPPARAHQGGGGRPARG